MVELKLGKLPDRVPVKLTIAVSPELNRTLNDYARAYETAYGQPESVAELVPAMLEVFLGSDRAFARMRKSSNDQGGVSLVDPVPSMIRSS